MDDKLYYIDEHDKKGIRFGLENILELLESLDNPHNKLKVIHIAGTNGKGSVGAYLLYILASAGMKIGRLSSPAVFDKYEFAQIMECIDDELVITSINEEYLDSKLKFLEKCNIQSKPSGFEVQVAISLTYFLEEKCDVVIVETGMGGTLDATNVFERTLCDVLTSISLDHTDMLGNSIEEITLNKCGIITQNANVVTTSTNKRVIDIIKNTCIRKDASLYIADVDNLKEMYLDINNNSFIYKNNKYVFTQNGLYQAENIILAVEVIRVLRSKGYNVSECDINRGLREAKFKGRFDIINKQIVVDGAHNINGIENLITSLGQYFENRKIIYVINIFKDKMYKEMLQLISTNAYKIILFSTDNERSYDSNSVKNELIKTRLQTEIISCNSIDDAISKAQEKGDEECIYVYAGSLSFMKELYERLNYNE